jgi:hypothetical protein
MPTSQEKANTVRKTIGDARAGRATLVELATAHELAENLGLKRCAEELRQRIATMTATPKAPKVPALLGDVAVGLISGVLIHKLVG